MCAQKMDTEIRQEQIVVAALSVAASQGVKAMTVERIAKLVGLAPSAIYRHFKNKSEILDGVIEMLRGRIIENIKAVREETSDPLEAVKRLLMRQIQLIMVYQAMPRILFSDDVYSADPAKKAKLLEVINIIIDNLTELYQEGQEKGIIRPDIEPRALASMFPGLFQPSVFLYHLNDGQFDIITQVDKTWKVFSDAVRVK